MKFKVGIEEEFFIIDKKSRALCHDLPDSVFDSCQKKILESAVTHEFFSSQLEISTHPCSSLQEVEDTLFLQRDILTTILNKHNLCFSASGTYPIAKVEEATISCNPRYNQLKSNYPIIAKNFLISGTHIHIESLPLKNRYQLILKLNCFLPFFLAFSASSPYFECCDTNLQSYRTCIIDMLPIAGFASGFSTKEAYDNILKTYKKINFIESNSDLRWYARPGDNFPTIENRLMDACPDIKIITALAGFYAALVLTLNTKDPSTLSFYTENLSFMEYYLWQCRRFSLSEASLINHKKGATIPLRKAFDELCEFIHPVAAKINALEHLDYLSSLFEKGTSSDQQRQIFNQTQSLHNVCDFLIKQSKGI